MTSAQQEALTLLEHGVPQEIAALPDNVPPDIWERLQSYLFPMIRQEKER